MLLSLRASGVRLAWDHGGQRPVAGPALALTGLVLEALTVYKKRLAAMLEWEHRHDTRLEACLSGEDLALVLWLMGWRGADLKPGTAVWAWAKVVEPRLFVDSLLMDLSDGPASRTWGYARDTARVLMEVYR